MKKIFYIAAIAAAFASCERINESYGDNTLSLDLRVVGLETKATEPGVNELNENKIIDVDVFLYQTDAENEGAKVYKRLAVNKDLSEVTTDTKNLHLSGDELDALGGNPSEIHIFVIANRPEGVTVNGTETIADLKVKAVTASKALSEKQDWFTMTCQCTATSTGSGYTASVVLERVMAKFGISIDAQDYDGEIEGTSGTWEPMTGTASVKLFGLKDDGKIGGNYNTSDTDIDDYHSVPAVFYSFPLKPLPENKPYYLIKLTWQLSTDHSVTKDTYYMVVCDYESFDANSFYQLDVDINYAGSMAEPAPSRITPSDLRFSVAPWRDGKVSGKDYHTEAVIKEARYLVVYSDEYTMNNVNSIDIPYTSSHPCKVRIVSSTWTDFSAATTVDRDLDDKRTATAYYYPGERDQDAEIHDGFFTLSHTLDNDFLNKNNYNPARYDISPIVFEVQITHSDDTDWTSSDVKTIFVTQLPAISIRAEKNEVGTAIRFYNGYNGSAPDNLGGSYAIGTQTPNQYIISVSVLPEGSDWVIGDPREDSPMLWTETTYFGTGVTLASGADIDSDGHTMEYYYPTREDGTADNVIAPSFRTASSYSRCASTGNSRVIIHRRGAVYQEMGHPAGRWRLLTNAEATIVAKLNNDNKIPDLYGGGNFLVAGGYINGGNVTMNPSSTGSVRLCYDEWYWSQSMYPTCDVNTFTWGDMPR